ncbi:hypothetical protein A1O3_03565 [Capronia epimyces CBS 606.96]|uniref:Uncharacterized protein n=1 Tax=Capronia epimyces CBS 606.96 TaxID=1182542 RepID=W9Y1C4_9EURO|nr:uncharacterized protein A1O3_03565 [Capronia epimyces CBS 606.96]EXJ86612.1 hypothetical protein A1O3_03565 [Capronia epimyces CBS 606.96]
MASRGDDRPYKVVYSTRARDPAPDPDANAAPLHKSRREVGYEYDYPLEKSSSRDYRFEVDRRPRPSEQTYPEAISLGSASAGGTTKIKYEVGRAKNADVYVKRSNTLVIERPGNNARYGSEYEVLRPERREDGSYVVEIGGRGPRGPRGYVDRDVDSSDTPSRASYSGAPKSSRGDDIAIYETSRRPGLGDRDWDRDRDRTVHQFSYKDVEIVEDPDDDPRYWRGRRPEAHMDSAAPPKRRKSAMRGRNNTPPEVLGSKRSQSVGFYRDQVSDHDASEQRHERPGAEARITGRYLRSHPDDDDDYGRAGRSRLRDDYGPQRSDLRLNDYEYDNDRSTYTEETMRRYEYEDDERPAHPTRLRHSKTYRRDQRDDDDRSAYSGFESRSRHGYYR